jgi:hypothetical protein
MIHKQIHNSSLFSTSGRISRGIFIQRLLIISVLLLLAYANFLHNVKVIKTPFIVIEEYIVRYFLIVSWILFSLIQYIKRIHDCSVSFIQSLKNPFIVFTKGTYGSNKYGLLPADIYYFKGVEDFNKEEFLAYQKKGNLRAILSILFLFIAIILILFLCLFNHTVPTQPSEPFITQHRYIHSFSDTTRPILSVLYNKDTLIKRMIYDTTFKVTVTRNRRTKEVTNKKRTFLKLDSTVIETKTILYRRNKIQRILKTRKRQNTTNESFQKIF